MPDVMIPGPAGPLEGRFTRAANPRAPIALALHPHPLYGGTMNNKVTYALFQTLSRHGCATLRFNFRGVGRSAGLYDQGVGETEDACAALDWLRATQPEASDCWIAGFSFGSWIGLRLWRQDQRIKHVIAVAPPASMFDFDFLNAPSSASNATRCGSALFLQGSRDDLAPEPASTALVERFTRAYASKDALLENRLNVNYHIVENADHFFSEHMDDLKRSLDAHIGKHLTLPVLPAPV
ncbi:Alpha/beta hydrolase [Azospirillaceae bacterium]